MNRILKACISLSLIWSYVWAADANEANATIRFGIAPFNSATGLVKTHRALRDYLSARLGAPVVIYTSVNHEAFLNDGLEKRFDLIATPAHFAPFFYEKGYIPLVKYKTPLDFIFVVREDDKIAKISDLKGKRIGIPDFLSLYYVVGLRWLNEHQKEIGEDYEQVKEPGHAAAISSVAANKIDAAITGTPVFAFASRSFSHRLKAVTFEKIELPPLMTMIDKSLGEATIDKTLKALEAFQTTEEGAEFFRFSGYGGYNRASEADIESAKVFALYVEQALKDKQ
ncbi:MAG: phosphate/phosphite/phosphonate ABC transporter substrate-binding protein [Helicobacteraceae bacterium]|jgi:phosphonate transport system substrate-binding protein|nr:phosphate/phosphite/phosphonate ABC transporter substrate-binding protein [Helicobacteraceae bacterium]